METLIWIQDVRCLRNVRSTYIEPNLGFLKLLNPATKINHISQENKEK